MNAHPSLPSDFKGLFWEYDFNSLTWEQDSDLIITRVLTTGDWEAVRWVRSRIGNDGVRDWIERRRGRGMNKKRLRFWELVLDIPSGIVDEWICDADAYAHRGEVV